MTVTVDIISNLAIFTMAGATAKDVRPDAILAACYAALKGRTPDEPDPDSAADDIRVRGFHVHAGVAWGLWKNPVSNKYDLVRLADVSGGPAGGVIIGRTYFD